MNRPAAANAPIPPQNLDAEESVLGACMLNPDAIDAVVDEGISAHDFYRESHGLIFTTITALHERGDPVDGITVADRLDEVGELERIGGKQRVHEIASLVPASRNARHYAAIVIEMATLRRLTIAGEEIQRLGWERPGTADELTQRAEEIVFAIGRSRIRQEAVMLRDALATAYSRLQELHAAGRDITGVASGFADIDALTAGFQPGNLVVIAARPSMGKSAISLDIAKHVAVKLGLPTALFTLEMSTAEVTQRLIGAEALVPSELLRSGSLDRERWKSVVAGIQRLEAAPLLIDDTRTITTLELRAKARRLKAQHPALALVVVDYLQLMTSGSRADNRTQDVSQTSRALKVLAAELDLPVIAVSQLSRQVEQRHDKRPILSDLRESGQIEADADLVMFIYRDEVYNPEDAAEVGTEGVAEINLAKHRNGPTGITKLAFVKKYATFTPLA